MVKKINPFITTKAFIELKDKDRDGIYSIFDCDDNDAKKRGFYVLVREGAAGVTRFKFKGHYRTREEAQAVIKKYYTGRFLKSKILNDAEYGKWRTGKIQKEEFKKEVKTKVKTWAKESKKSLKENVKSDVKGIKKDYKDWSKRSAKKWSQPIKKEYPSPIFGFDDLTGGFTLQRPARINPVRKRVKYRVKKITVVTPKKKAKKLSIDELALQREKAYFAEQLRGFRIQHDLDKKEYVEEPEEEKKDVEQIAKEMLGAKLRKKYDV